MAALVTTPWPLFPAITFFTETPDNDILYAGSGNDMLYGDAGNDTLVAGTGSAFMHGGSDADTFKFTSANTGTNVIDDFKVSDRDKIDIANVLQGYGPATQTISNFVHATQQGTNTVLFVDPDGTANGSHFTDLTVIQGVSHFDVAAMIASGNLIV